MINEQADWLAYVIIIILLVSGSIGFIKANEKINELKEEIEWLEDVADIYRDTWRESDCGFEIEKIQREYGIIPFDDWKELWS